MSGAVITCSGRFSAKRTVIRYLFSRAALIGAAALSILTGAPGAVPRAATQDPEQLERHLRNVFLERRLALEEAWEDAPEDRREAVRGLFRDLTRMGVPAVYTTSAAVLTDARALLQSSAGKVTDLPLAQRIAASLDLIVLPGAFSAGEGGEEVIARVLPAHTQTLRNLIPRVVEIGLVWIGPDGSEVRARTEPVHKAALVMPGFEMYFRTPPSKPGRWQLVPEVRIRDASGERVGRGVGVSVHCVAHLFDRYDRLRGALAQGEPAAAARLALERALLTGLRDAMVPAIPRLLSVAEGSAAEGDGLLRPRPVPDAWGAGQTYCLAACDGDVRGEIVIVAPALQDPEWALIGPQASRWRALAADREVRIWVTGLRPDGRGAPDLFALLAARRAELEGLPLTLVLRAPAFTRLRMALLKRQGEPLPFDRLVLNTVLLGQRVPRRLLSVPTLVFEPLERDGSLTNIPQESGPSLYLRLRADPPQLAERDLPDTIAEWWDLLE